MDDDSVRLLEEFVDGDSDAAARIYYKYVARLIGLARNQLSPMLQPRVDPEDIVQSAYRSFFAYAKDDKVVLSRSGDLWRVLAGFTVNKAQKRVERELAQKKDPRLERAGSTWVKTAVEEEPTAEQVASVLEQLTLYMQTISPRNRFILELRLQGLSVAEIAGELKNQSDRLGESVANTSEATIRRVLREAKSDLRRMLFED